MFARIDAGAEPAPRPGIRSIAENSSLGPEKAQEGPMTVLIYYEEAAWREPLAL
jgi:hypothetical protein